VLEYGPEDVPTDHRWNSAEYVAEWAATANEAPHRRAMFDAFVAELGALQLTVTEHLQVLADAGYVHPRCVLDLGRVAFVRAERRG
jgi:hypothetical protein